MEDKARKADGDPDDRGSWMLCQAVKIQVGGREPWKSCSWEYLIKSLLQKKFTNTGRNGFEGQGRLGRVGRGD